MLIECVPKGLVILERNYLEVYIFDKWTGNLLPNFEIGEKFVPSNLSLKEGRTSSPNLLTEADLVSLMDKNGIGESSLPTPILFDFVTDDF